MHIDGSKMAEFSCYKWTPVTYNRNKVLIPDVDRVEVSELGSGLSDVKSRAEARDWSKAVEGLRDNDTVDLIASSVMQIGDTMERMKAISKLAEESYISEDDRLTLQSEMTSLQAELFRQTYSMGLKKAGLSRDEITDSVAEIDRYEASCVAVIERERRRIADGADADPFTDNGDGTFSVEIFGFPPDDSGELSCERTEYGFKLTGDMENLTRIYEKSDMQLSFDDFTEKSKLSVMNVDDAAFATDSLDERMDELLKKLESLTSFYEKLKKRQDQESDVSEAPAVEKEKKFNYDLPEFALFESDMRIIKPNNPSEEIFKIADAFLKDQIFEKLGFGDFIPNRDPERLGGPASVVLI